MARPFLEAVDGALQGTAKPYGFTVVVWGTGALLISGHGSPGTGEVFLFGAGAIAAYGTLRIASGRREFRDAEPDIASRREDLFSGGAIHAGAVAAGLGLGALIALVDGGWAWALASFAAVFVYLLVTSVELMRGSA